MKFVAFASSMATVPSGNIFAGIHASASAGCESVDQILEKPGLRVERIVSHGHASPPGFWYDQGWDEWVLVLLGQATLRFEDEADARILGAGDYLFIPAGKRHRVDWTDETQPTVWLAIHFEAAGPDGVQPPVSCPP